MAVASEPSIYDGTASVDARNSTLLTHTAELYLPKFREVIHTSTNFLKSLTVAAFGKAAAIGNASFGGATATSGKGIRLEKVGYQISFPLMTTGPNSYQVSRLDNINPQHNDPGKAGAYSWVRFVVPVFIPEEFMMDNVGSARLMNRFDTEMKLAQLTAIRDVTYIALGHSSAPSGSPDGLSKLVSVTQGTVAGINASSYSWWQNQYDSTTATTPGGGGELDRPLQLLRSMERMLLKIRKQSGSTNEQVLLGTTGAWQYYSRARYADREANGMPNMKSPTYDAADIDHLVFNGRPFIYDSYVTVPNGGTASKEVIYFLDYNSLGISFKADQYFHVEGWEKPRAHDKQRYYQMNIWYRMVPYVFNRRVQGVIENIQANPDAA